MEISDEAKVEAVLFTAGRPLSLEEISKLTGAGKKRAEEAIKKVESNLKERSYALELDVINGMYIIRLKPEIVDVARKASLKPFLSRSIMRTLTIVAFYQPVSSADLVQRRGSLVYTHLKLLEKLGFISYKRDGRKKIYETTPYFYRFFGLPEDRQVLKEKLSSYL
ncbi:MAG: SMC-Scp complex subunit ScpB [Nitrososphaerota archaeon]|jgi:segregation and condensation protein B|nr:SMC-Scp complex subunit ScpB [Nitrososphaerota archaeon]MDG6928279.1 SMC-Scp complex subunit ScpB [Nitrososphaerota archaeon]MDG6929741.1 SMC-Scp complex subunit ScpB [Nitrososphaerota archaeon]MDG6932823.1 SMC-Scp complex subunit ScpB [Nitrososphaerota archaeon]MDG6935378.1 SMC-Scp complex subunit ScpB [Nitrososphaerota archaeon]